MTITEVTTPILITITEIHSQLLPNLYLQIPQIDGVASMNQSTRNRELTVTYPTWEKRKIMDSKVPFRIGICYFPGVYLSLKK